MTLSLLQITDFRNLAAITLAPVTGLNLICGQNGSGKTSLLEAIHYLSLGRSFRQATATSLIRHETTQFSLFSQLVNECRELSLGVERHLNGQLRLRIAEQDATSLVELASYLPLHIIHSQSHQLLESGPAQRRKFVDWGLFYQSPPFLTCWRHFTRVLKQRNAVLRDQRSQHELTMWTEELVKVALPLDQLRRDYVTHLIPFILAATQELLGRADFTIKYHPGWDEKLDYLALLTSRYREDYQAGFTQFGPHRADLLVTLSDFPVKHFLSRGQQKLLICAMMIAQGKYLFHGSNKRLIYLIDDLPAELDLLNRQKLISLLAYQQTQVFVTAIENDTLYGAISDKLNVPMKVFHVEHGHVVG